MAENKKILWLASWYPNRTAPFTGDFIQRHAFATALVQPLELIFVTKDQNCAEPRGFTVESRQTGMLTETIIYYRSFEIGIAPIDRLLSFFKYRRLSRKVVREFIQKHGKPELVHVHVSVMAGDTALWMKRKWGIPFVITENWTGYYETDPEGLRHRDLLFRSIVRKVLSGVDLFLPVSRELGEIINKKFGPLRFRVIPNVVNTELFRYEDERDVKKHRFIHVSAMSQQKNVPAILRSFANVLASFPQASLTMAGPADEDLMGLANQLGISKAVNWLGEISYSAVAEAMRNADSFVLFSNYENLPCVALEALCSGVPVISSAVGGLPEIINASNGILVTPGNEMELSQAMIKMMTDAYSFNRASISAEASAKYNYLQVGNEIIDAYKGLVRKN